MDNTSIAYDANGEPITEAPLAKDVLQTYTGRVLTPLDFWPNDFCVDDIAWSLAHQCRYNGHTKLYYSIATHSLIVSHFVPYHLKLEALLHDATEAYLTDLPSPIKRRFPEYRKLEDSCAKALATRFRIVYPEHWLVKRADDYVFKLESSLVMGGEMARRFGMPPSEDRNFVERAITEAAALGPREEAKRFMAVFECVLKTRITDIELARETGAL